jgi:hypothetical protein
MARSFACFVASTRLCVAGVETGGTYHFRPPFLWFISFGGAKEMNYKKNRPISETVLFYFLPCALSRKPLAVPYFCFIFASMLNVA